MGTPIDATNFINNPPAKLDKPYKGANSVGLCAPGYPVRANAIHALDVVVGGLLIIFFDGGNELTLLGWNCECWGFAEMPVVILVMRFINGYSFCSFCSRAVAGRSFVLDFVKSFCRRSHFRVCFPLIDCLTLIYTNSSFPLPHQLGGYPTVCTWSYRKPYLR